MSDKQWRVMRFERSAQRAGSWRDGVWQLNDKRANKAPNGRSVR